MSATVATMYFIHFIGLISNVSVERPNKNSGYGLKLL